MNKQQAIDTLSSFKREDYMMANAAAVKVARFLTTQGPVTILYMLELAHLTGRAEVADNASAMAAQQVINNKRLMQLLREMMR